MTERDLEQRLREAFAASASSAVDDAQPVPPPRFATVPARRRPRLLAPLAAAAAVLAVAGGVLALTEADRSHSGTTSAAARHPGVAASSVAAASITPSSAAGRTVHIRLANAGGARYGIGMPVIATFSRRITDARPFARATSVTVDGKPIAAAWYFERTASGRALEAHLRPRSFWPAHAKVHVALDTAGLPAGGGLVFDDAVTLDFTTSAATIVTVDDRQHRLTVTSDGRQLASYPVSLGANRTPTSSGTKVVLAKRPAVCLDGPGYHQCDIKYAQQLTYSGEYLLAAPWNETNIRTGVDSSNGCTNLMPADARALYRMLHVGDVVRFPDASGPPVSTVDGVADWNIPWPTWRTGGLLPTS